MKAVLIYRDHTVNTEIAGDKPPKDYRVKDPRTRIVHVFEFLGITDPYPTAAYIETPESQSQEQERRNEYA